MPEQIDDKEYAGFTIKPQPQTLPRPTIWPATLALGTTLLAFGVVTSWIISIAGLGLFLLAANGWFKDLRDEQLL